MYFQETALEEAHYFSGEHSVADFEPLIDQRSTAHVSVHCCLCCSKAMRLSAEALAIFAIASAYASVFAVFDTGNCASKICVIGSVVCIYICI